MNLSEYCFETFGNPYEYQKNLKYFYPDIKYFQMIKGLRNPYHIKKILMHPLIHKPFENILFDIAMDGLCDEIKSFNGCFNIRMIKGVEILSTHSWAVSLDFNKEENELGMVPLMSPKIVEIFKKHGFDWGGDFERLDGMHFQASIKLLKGEL